MAEKKKEVLELWLLQRAKTIALLNRNSMVNRIKAIADVACVWRVMVFVCMATKAVHLEVVSELSTYAFLAAFDRFVTRWGLPHDVFSDCGTNFAVVEKYLHTLVNDPIIWLYPELTSHARCIRYFNPPSAPHFGGLWQAAVRSFKTLLIRLVGVHNFSRK